MTMIADDSDVSFTADGVTLAEYAEDMSPDGARALARDLLAAADEVARLHVTNRRQCAREGHDLHGYDARRNNLPVHREYCQRVGCDYEAFTDGWRQEYPAKTHHVPVGFHVEERECYGPGCPYCDSEEFGRVFREFMDVAGREADAAMQRLVNSPPTWPISQTEITTEETP